MSTILVGIPIEILKENSPWEVDECGTIEEFLSHLISLVWISNNFQFFKNFGADGSGNCVPEDLITVFNSVNFLYSCPVVFQFCFFQKIVQVSCHVLTNWHKGAFNTTRTRWGGRGSKMSVFVHAQGIKTVQTEGGGVYKMAKFCPRSCWMTPKKQKSRHWHINIIDILEWLSLLKVGRYLDTMYL